MQDIVGYDGSLGIATESVQNPAGKRPEAQCRQTTTTALGSSCALKETLGEREGLEGGSMAKVRAERKTRRRFWTPSLVACIQRRRRRPHVERGADNAFLDVMTGHAAELPAGDLINTNEDRKANTNSRSSVGMWSAFKRHLTTSGNPQKMKGARLDHAAHRGSKDRPCPKASFRKKMGCFFKRDRKKPSNSGHGGMGVLGHLWMKRPWGSLTDHHSLERDRPASRRLTTQKPLQRSEGHVLRP
ncbi:hypothetical protein AAFF_G00240740 [Aldrovandia affinis]|uniref:Uncharacterized protein n=1 Tax=Aldrovandia affinis TaxID=143900 RepID=A0AAD7SVM2_9TELE|nr:hypothetical protein AAFF_G00240740 [Aldrovandia affinis]